MSDGPRYWQVSAGDAGRDYSDDFLAFGLAFMGKKQSLTLRKVEPGDRLILKRGKSAVVAVGEVVTRNGCHYGENDKEWLRDYDGWDLGAYCHVDWRALEQPEKVDGLMMGAIAATHRRSLQERAERILSERPVCKISAEPPRAQEVSDEDMLFFLVQEGLRPSIADELTSTLSRIRLLARYYYTCCRWEDVREHETRTFLVIPLLLALGWSEQQLKIELGISARCRIDIACFARPYISGGANDCRLLVETKGFSQGLDNAHNQAKHYALDFPECDVILVTNGFCYKAYQRVSEQEFSGKPCAYLNLLRPRDRYRKDTEDADGCLETLKLLLPRT